MHLTHLALQGYKSFANKTEFEFPPGITAIVGPNGTGKSNIADAIRWALGERSMTILRAKSTADMIFAGGDRRSRAGMAEVTLTFDNADGGLPVEFSEVTIARRAYRSGENEYLINGSQVLLRDIEELLAQSSLSERTYTVVGQGVVDAALSLRPQERRALFEEAAGITLYRDRREKTVERLDETERNLERVHDIVGEIAPRLGRLERDARQVEEHRRLSAHLARLQRTWYGYRWGEQQAALERALEWAGRLDKMLVEREEQAAGIDERLSEVREREGMLRRQLRDWYRESGDLHEAVDEARRELAVAEERERLLGTRREELLEEIEPLRTRREEQARRTAELRRRVEALTEELQERRRRLTEIESEAAEMARAAEEAEQAQARTEQQLRVQRDRLEGVNQALGEARQEISRLDREQAVAEERVRHLASRREEVVKGLEPLSAEQELQRERIAQQRTRLAEAEAVLEAKQSELDELERAWEAFHQQPPEPNEAWRRVADELSSCRADIEQLDEERREVRQEEAALAGELKALERSHATGTAFARGVQELLEADLDGLVGLLAELIDVPARWEQAVAAALGGDRSGSALQAVVMEDSAVVERAHRILQERGGRATVIPLDVLRGPSGRSLPPRALSAADVVVCEDVIRPVVETLLRSVALCEELSEARALRSEMPPGSACVTREGTVLRADGSYVIGALGSEGVLTDQRLRRELSERLERLQGRVEELDRLRRVRQEIAASLEHELSEIERRAEQDRDERSHRLQQRLGEARTAVAVSSETVRSQRTSLEREIARLDRMRSERESLRRQSAILAEQHAAELERAAALRLALDAPRAEDSAAGEAARMGEGTETAAGLRLHLRQADRRCRELEREREALSARVTELERRLVRLTKQAADARQAAARFERETLSEAKGAVLIAEASFRSDGEALERESTLLERLHSQIDARLERTAELKAERENLIERIASLRRQASRLETELGEIRDQIQPAEDGLERLETEQTALEEKRVHAQNRVREAEERHGRAQLDVERRRDDLRALAQRIDEDLGLVELELGDAVTAQAPLPMRPIVSELPVVEELPEGLREEMQLVSKRLRRLGAINPNAPAELAEVRNRYDFLTEQAADLGAATERLRRSVSELDAMMRRAFRETFDQVAEGFSRNFTTLFDGGEARVFLTEPDAPLRSGVAIVAKPPGKRAQRLALLSGGERALTAVALLFALLDASPTPFCVFDEVDAMLDDANVGRFRAKLEQLAEGTQVIIITHNRGTIESADAVYGVSMGANAVSQVVSLRMEAVEGGSLGAAAS